MQPKVFFTMQKVGCDKADSFGRTTDNTLGVPQFFDHLWGFARIELWTNSKKLVRDVFNQLVPIATCQMSVEGAMSA